MHFVTSANIQVFSSVSAAPFRGGGWKATLRPSWRGTVLSVLLSLLDPFASRILTPLGPTDPRAGRVIETEFFRGFSVEARTPEGDGARGRLLRFSGFFRQYTDH